MSSDRRCDVFLSFRAEDTRRTFVSHLYNELDRRGISAFRDHSSADSSEITEAPTESSATEAIEGSKFAIVVVSENYAVSGWCLDELVKILELREKGSLTVVPIFYGVEPSDLRKQTGKIAQLFELHETRRSSETVRMWRTALTRLAHIAGEDSRKWEDEAEMIREITVDISGKLKHPKLDVGDIPVGMEDHVKALYDLLDLESKDGIRVIGIWGDAGVGKTTLARYVYENISHYFHTHVFVENVCRIYHGSEEVLSKVMLDATGSKPRSFISRLTKRKENVKGDGKRYLDRGKESAKGDSHSLEENILLKEIQRRSPILRSPNLDSYATKGKLGCRKVLLVADDVDSMGQCKDVNALASDLGPGSRIILTTRDKTLLEGCGENRVYEVGYPRYDEAMQLFCRFAFKQRDPPSSGFERLAFRAVQISGRLPLALKVLGSFLQGKGEEDWETALKQLEEGKTEDVMGVLQNIQSEAGDGGSESAKFPETETSTS